MRSTTTTIETNIHVDRPVVAGFVGATAGAASGESLAVSAGESTCAGEAAATGAGEEAGSTGAASAAGFADAF